MSKIETTGEIQELPLILIKNMIMLATSGFGVVVALAWNEAIKASVATYIAPFLGESSGVVSLFIYATVVTTLAVLVTMQLAAVEKRLSILQKKEEKTAEATATKKSKKKKK